MSGRRNIFGQKKKQHGGTGTQHTKRTAQTKLRVWNSGTRGNVRYTGTPRRDYNWYSYDQPRTYSSAKKVKLRPQGTENTIITFVPGKGFMRVPLVD